MAPGLECISSENEGWIAVETIQIHTVNYRQANHRRGIKWWWVLLDRDIELNLSDIVTR